MRAILIIIFVSIVSVSFGQNLVYPLLPKYYRPLDSTVLNNENDEEIEKKSTLLKKHDRFSQSLAVGTSYTVFGNSMSMMSTYIAPSFNYHISPKFNISVNGIIMQNNMSGIKSEFGSSPEYGYNSNVSNYGISGIAHYQLTDKWSIWGDGAYFENQSIFTDYRAQAYDTDFKTLSIGVGYKVNNHLHFNFQYTYSNGLNPSYNIGSPYSNSILYPNRSGFDMWDY
jgi:Putative beta-barrel porin-2, OmpL-like. bbp2